MSKKSRKRKRDAQKAKQKAALLTDGVELGPLPDPPVPQKIDQVTLAFPANVIGTLLPEWHKIPDEFKRLSHPWAQFVMTWFALGMEATFHCKPGVDKETAQRHLQACLGSFEPKHEHKIAGAAYLASCFFDRPLPR